LQPDAATHGRVVAAYGQLPLAFEANQGQTDGQVHFMARSQGMGVFLTLTEAVLVLPSTHSVETLPEAVAGGPRPVYLPARSAGPTPTAPTAHPVVRLSFVGASPTPQVVGLEELPGTVNYFLSNDPTRWRTNIPTYAKVKYQDVYPGVDLIYYGNQQQLEYDFVIAPGADPKVIRLALNNLSPVATCF